MLISYRNSKGGKSLSSALKFMIPFSVVLAVHSILEKFLLSYIDYWSVFFWNILGAFCGVLFLLTFSKPRREFTEAVSAVGKRSFLCGVCGRGGVLFGHNLLANRRIHGLRLFSLRICKLTALLRLHLRATVKSICSPTPQRGDDYRNNSIEDFCNSPNVRRNLASNSISL